MYPPSLTKSLNGSMIRSLTILHLDGMTRLCPIASNATVDHEQETYSKPPTRPKHSMRAWCPYLAEHSPITWSRGASSISTLEPTVQDQSTVNTACLRLVLSTESKLNHRVHVSDTLSRSIFDTSRFRALISPGL